MDADTAFVCYPEIDDRFLGDWIEFGMIQLNAYLASHARFARYCDKRDNRSSQRCSSDGLAPRFRQLESAILRAGSVPLD
jgi:hypothetical protein